MSVIVQIREIHRKFNKKRVELIEEHTKLVESIEKSHKDDLKVLEKERNEELSKIGATECNIVWEAKYYRTEKTNEGDDFTDKWVNRKIGYSRYFSDSAEAIRIKTGPKIMFDGHHELYFESIDFCDFNQVPQDRLDWIDDGAIRETYR
jgi:hypothetical protein